MRIGRRVRVLRSDLEQLMDQGYRGTPPPATEGPQPAGIWDGDTPSDPVA